MGPLFFFLLSHVNLDDVAGVAPVPSPTSGANGYGCWDFLPRQHFAFRVDGNDFSTPLLPQVTSRHLWGAQDMIYYTVRCD